MGCCASTDSPDNDKYLPTHSAGNGGQIQGQISLNPYPPGPNDFNRQGSFGRSEHHKISTQVKTIMIIMIFDCSVCPRTLCHTFPSALALNSCLDIHVI